VPGRWVVVVPVKDAAAGKTRLAGALDDRSRTALARAMALDTIAAAAACEAVGVVVVVTADRVVAAEAAGVRPGYDRAAMEAVGGRPCDDRAVMETSAGRPRAGGAAVRVISEPSHAGARSGLDAAAFAGVANARTLAPAAPVAVLLGDLPALRPEDLGAALVVAEEHARAMVADAPGTGTTLLTISAAAPFDSRFGAGSAAAHVALGYVPLDIADTSTLRRDIDLPADLDTLLTLHPGPHTARLLNRLIPQGGRAEG